MTQDFHSALEWASSASAGDYLITYDDTGVSHDDDPGSRCGYSDPDLAAIERDLRERGMTLRADDIGLVAAERPIDLGDE
jgi:hypothetical protein